MSREILKQKYNVNPEKEDYHIEVLAVLEEIRDELRILNGKA